MITGINESKTLSHHLTHANVNVDLIEENVIQINGEIMTNVCKKRHACEKDYVWTPSTRICENGKYIASIMDNLVIRLDVMKL